MSDTYQNITMTEEKRARTGFFHTVALHLKKNRLGDLLVSSGMITTEQLESALAMQARTREPLGKVLIKSGAITAAMLYRKLAEQWCVRVSAYGLTFMMGATAVPSAARAGSGQAQSGQIVLASATTATPFNKAAALQYPSLFGTTEIRSDNTAAFTKWTKMLDRFEKQLTAHSGATAPRLQLWKAELSRIRHLSTADKIAAVNNYINKVQYITDAKNWGQTDHWATPVEFFSRGGDCEDFAIAKYASLRALGVPAERLRIAIVHDKIKNIPHAVLIVYAENGQSYVLDNQDKAMRNINNVTRYKPIFSINQGSWWMHRVQNS
ncbi:MAG: hypothetical protein HND56_03695 [Pseudomonadota bacterium]|nr:hypothetical protein [Pseudomonadota bacterium]QKK04846.1 MAG: hypothetical protein HND56_03695 [Pseudomonadota bacterium]|tara:strand:- start:83 stop:1051 length:969 start_codon:yes stop_codon:yes gene_type:complete